MLEDEYFRSNYELRSMLRVLFNADFFKQARFAKVKSPAEAVIGTMRLVGDFTTPKPGLPALVAEMRYMGQDLANPPTVEGWHTGKEWIDSGTLVERINFTADQMGNINLPGIRTIINRLGLHARATAKLVQLLSTFRCQATLEARGREVNAKSIMGVMLLAAGTGTTVVLRVNGEDEQAAADAVAALFERRFDEDS